MFETLNTNAGQNYLTLKEEKRLFAYINQIKGSQAQRDYVLLKTARFLGLRREEALALNVGDVRDKKILIVDERIARKGAQGIIEIDPKLQRLFVRFFEVKRHLGESLEDDAPLFVSKKGKRLSGRAFNELMTKWCTASGIGVYTPHALRHTKAHRILEHYLQKNLSEGSKAQALLVIQKQLRHKSITSTAIYLQPTKEDMSNAAGL